MNLINQQYLKRSNLTFIFIKQLKIYTNPTLFLIFKKKIGTFFKIALPQALPLDYFGGVRTPPALPLGSMPASQVRGFRGARVQYLGLICYLSRVSFSKIFNKLIILRIVAN